MHSKLMNLDRRLWMSAILLGILVARPSFASADLPPEDVARYIAIKAAADQGHAQSQIYLGLCFQSGRGVARDEVEALKWFRKAADQGFAIAQAFLGGCYANGSCVAKDEVEAAKWYRKAADQGLSQAQFLLGTCYVAGRGVAKDEAEGMQWYRKAADQGHVHALFEMGRFYADGLVVSKDEVEAYAYFNLVAGIGFDLAIEKRDNLEKGMPPDARIQGQKRTKELLKEFQSKTQIAAKKAEDAKKSGK
jgi:TPR repeat protein